MVYQKKLNSKKDISIQTSTDLYPVQEALDSNERLRFKYGSPTSIFCLVPKLTFQWTEGLCFQVILAKVFRTRGDIPLITLVKFSL
jgi:hypothetical protein